MRSRLVLKAAICFALVAITFAVFWQTHRFSFVNYDDPQYVTDNPHITTGLSGQNVWWAFTQIHSHNWHPLTSLSHMLDCQLFGLNAGAHHLVNVVLHSVTALLLFLLLESLTARVWSSAFVAAMFAIHPLHVESVAWISERKDVLSGLFLVLTLIAYVRYSKEPGIARYVMMSILFVLGLMSKPMLVTLPFILLLLDYWPLNRFESSTLASLVIEKIPLFLLSMACAVMTLVVQNKGAVGLVRLDVLPFSWRMMNALVTPVIYIRQMFWPVGLALGYSHPDKLPMWQVIFAAAVLGAAMLLFWMLRKQKPFLIVGWCWYLIMLLPVIGLIQVGGQAHADRYTYLPLIGICVAATWMIVDLSKSWRFQSPVLGAVGIVTLTALMWRSSNQVSYWHDSERLWRHSLAVTKDNDVAHSGLARLFSEQRRVNDAIAEYETVLQIGYNPDVETTLANLLLEHGRVEEAIRCYRHVAQLQPSSALAQYNLAVGLHRAGQLSEAIVHYKEALRIQPDYPDADYFLGEALFQNGRTDETKQHLEKH